MYGLDLDTVQNIQSVFSKFDAVEKAVLYGSRAKGNYKHGSDIDLTLFGDNLTLQTIYAIQDALDELYLPYKFDLSIHSQIDNAALLEHMERVGKLFYKKTVSD